MIRAFDGCRCEPGQCKSKAKDLGRFSKTETIPLFTASARGTVLVATCIAVIAVLVWAPGHINENAKRVALITQENIRHD